MKTIILLSFLLFSSLYSLEILYIQNPPLIKENKNTITGTLANPVIKALDKLNVKYTLKQRSFKEQMKLIRYSKNDICAISWKKDEEYEKIANFSKAIYTEKSYGIITQKRYDIKNYTHINELITEPKYRLMVKQNNQYSKEFLKIINSLPKRKVKTHKDYNLITLIAKRKGDFMFISYENAKYFLKSHKYKSRFKFVPIKGLPRAEKKYLACSKSVDKTVIEAFNKNLK